MNQCNRCGGEVPEFAQACMHCGAVFTNHPQYIAEEKAKKEADQASSGCAVVIVVVVIVVVVIALSLGWEPYSY